MARFCRQASLLPNQDPHRRALAMHALARQCVVAARHIPPGEDYDRARGILLAQAAQIACDAASADLEGQSWNTYSPLAAYAVRLCDALAEMGNIYETSGTIREQRAWALMQCGRFDEALDQALKVRSLRGGTGDFEVNLARLYCARGEPGPALDCVLRAIKDGGFEHIRELKLNPDFQILAGRPVFKRLTTVSVLVAGVGEPPAAGSELVPLRGAAANVRVTNASAFALTNVRLDISLVSAPDRKVNVIHCPRIGRIKPGQSAVLEGVLTDVIPGKVCDAMLTLKCDQGERRIR
jgi:hypothetical protein